MAARAAAVNHYRKCGCGCDVSVKTAAAWFLPGHAPEWVAIENASGQWVKVTDISLEPAAWARIGRVEELDGLFVKVAIADHPTCGNFSWSGYQRGKMVQVKPTHKR
jgi:hypothetical protein